MRVALVLIALATAPAEAQDLEKGEALYSDYCAACHGANLEGQPDWRSAGPDGVLPAPPHDETGHTWHHGDRMLFDYTKMGGQAYMKSLGVDWTSGMPAFDGLLTDDEIRDVLAYIRSTWPDWVREVQLTRTEAERMQAR